MLPRNLHVLLLEYNKEIVLLLKGTEKDSKILLPIFFVSPFLRLLFAHKYHINEHQEQIAYILDLDKL